MLEISGRFTGKTKRLIEFANKNQKKFQHKVHHLFVAFSGHGKANLRRRISKSSTEISNVGNFSIMCSDQSIQKFTRGLSRDVIIYVDEFDLMQRNIDKFIDYGLSKTTQNIKHHGFVTTPRKMREEGPFQNTVEDPMKHILMLHGYEFENKWNKSVSKNDYETEKNFLRESRGQFTKNAFYVNPHPVDRLHRNIKRRIETYS